MRINARLDEDTGKKMEYLRQQSGKSQTDIIKNAIDLYYESRRSKARAKITTLLESDFIGCANGPADLSDDYKNDLTRALEDKHGPG